MPLHARAAIVVGVSGLQRLPARPFSYHGAKEAAGCAKHGHRAKGDVADDLALLLRNQRGTKAAGRAKCVNQPRLAYGRE